MNRVWAIKAEQRLSQLEERTKTIPPGITVSIVDALARLEARIATLENKPNVGRPPKDKTE